jgi:hypothetical protein
MIDDELQLRPNWTSKPFGGNAIGRIQISSPLRD